MQPTTELGSASGPHGDIPTPRNVGTSASRRESISAIARQAWTDEARRDGSDNSLAVTATSCWSSINNRYLRSKKTGNDFEIDMHDLWFLYYQTSKNISHENSNQDQLVVQILQVREQGALSRLSGIDRTTSTATTSDGVIWVDLPFFASDMCLCWANNWATMAAADRLNFASFLAKLASIGVSDDKLCRVGLAVLYETLEVTRPLGRLGDNRDEDPNRPSRDMTIASLLPAANAWLYHAGWKIIQLSDTLWNDNTDDVGELLRADAPTTNTSAGFSPERWMVWLRRLEAIAQQATESGESSLTSYTLRVMENMLLTVNERESAVKRKLAASLGAIQYRTSVQELG